MPKAKQTQKDPAVQKTARSQKSVEDSRSFKRRSVLWPAHLHIGRHVISCQVWNLSLGGARVRVDLPIKEGTEVVLSMKDRGDLKAEVVWVDGGAMGLEFRVGAATVKSMFKDRLHVLGLDERG